MSNLLFDLLFDALIAYKAESVEFNLGFLEFFEVGIPRVMDFGFGVLRAVGGEGADSFSDMAVAEAGFGITFGPKWLPLLHGLIIDAE